MLLEETFVTPQRSFGCCLLLKFCGRRRNRVSSLASLLLSNTSARTECTILPIAVTKVFFKMQPIPKVNFGLRRPPRRSSTDSAGRKRTHSADNKKHRAAAHHDTRRTWPQLQPRRIHAFTSSPGSLERPRTLTCSSHGAT